MSAVDVRAALETALAAMTPAMPTAWENLAFTPMTGTPYQRATTLFADPHDVELTRSLFWQEGLFQISLFYPLGEGSAAATVRADLIRKTFDRGNTFQSGDVVVTIPKTPSIYPAMTETDRFMIPVRVPFRAQLKRS